MKIAFITPQNKRDYLCETILEGFHKLGHELVVSDPGNGFCDAPMSDADFVRTANSADVLVSFFGKARNCPPPRHHLLELVKLPRECKVYCDGSEWSATGWEGPLQASNSLVIPAFRRGEPWLNQKMLVECGHYFKRECYHEDIAQNIVPLPFALCDRHILAPTVKDIDVFCSFGHTKTGLRKEAIELCERFKQTMDPALGLNVVVRSGLTQAEYVDHLSRSRIVVDAFGGGDTTDRFWEGVGARACVLYQRHNVVTPNPFVDFEHAVSWATVSELSNSLHRLVYTADEAEDIGERGLEHAMRYHTAKHRAQLILDTVFAR
jgi:hypothetical protein